MHTKEIRLIAMDMDGTLLDRSQRIAPQEQEALKAADPDLRLSLIHI